VAEIIEINKTGVKVPDLIEYNQKRETGFPKEGTDKKQENYSNSDEGTIKSGKQQQKKRS